MEIRIVNGVEYYVDEDGFMVPVIAGGAEDGEEEEEDTGEEDEETDEEEDEDEEISPEEARRIKKALEKANKEAKDYRLEVKRLKKEQESETEKAIREAKEEGAKQMRSRWLRSEAKAALLSAGVTKALSRATRLIDFDAIEVDEEGNIEGLDDQVETLQDELPELFGKTGDEEEEEEPKSSSQRIKAKIDGSNKDNAGEKKKSSAQKLVAAMRGEG